MQECAGLRLNLNLTGQHYLETGTGWKQETVGGSQGNGPASMQTCQHADEPSDPTPDEVYSRAFLQGFLSASSLRSLFLACGGICLVAQTTPLLRSLLLVEAVLPFESSPFASRVCSSFCRVVSCRFRRLPLSVPLLLNQFVEAFCFETRYVFDASAFGPEAITAFPDHST